MADRIPDWFHNTVVDGLQGLCSAGFQGTPSQDTIEATTRVWSSILWSGYGSGWNMARDQHRLAEAFVIAAARSEGWMPVPKHVMNALPPCPTPVALPPPAGVGPSPEVKARLMRSIKELAGKMTRTPWSS